MQLYKLYIFIILDSVVNFPFFGLRNIIASNQLFRRFLSRVTGGRHDSWLFIDGAELKTPMKGFLSIIWSLNSTHQKKLDKQDLRQRRWCEAWDFQIRKIVNRLVNKYFIMNIFVETTENAPGIF